MRRALVLVLAFLVALPLAGCIDNVRSKLGIGGTNPTPVVPPPFKQIYHDFVAPNEGKSYDFPVTNGATRARLDATLTCDSGPLPQCPPTSPARITIGFLDPAGAPIGGTKTLDPSTPTGTLQLTTFQSYGTYKITVTGNGASAGGAGASYLMNLTVLYS